MQNLIDGDFASNNGGWQWSASTGTDAAPYFRIFNPVTQSQNFDPDGLFIKSFVPELEHLSPKEIHLPPFDIFTKADYPKPIVDLQKSASSARAKIWAHKKHPAVQKEKIRLLQTHVNAR